MPNNRGGFIVEKWLKFVIKHSSKIILLIFILSFIFLIKIPDLDIDTSMEKNVPEDLPEMIFLQQVNEKFPLSTDFALIGVVMPPGETIYTPEALAKISRLSESSYQLPGAAEVISITEYQQMRGGAMGFSSRPLYDPQQTTADDLQELQKKVEQDPLLAQNFVAMDGQAALIMVLVDRELIDSAEQDLFITELESLIANEKGAAEIFIGGKMVWDTQVGDMIIRDLIVLIPFLILILLLVLWVSFGTLMAVIVPLSTVALSLIWTLGAMAYLNIPISLSTMATPVLLSAIGIAYGIHILNRYYEDLQIIEDKTQLIMHSVSRVGMAVLFSGLTTIAGFLSLASSRIPPVRTLGFVTALGILLSLFFSLTVLPAIMNLYSSTKARKRPIFNNLLSNFLRTVANVINGKSWIIVIILSSLMIFALLGLPRITTEVDPLGSLPPENELRQAFSVLNDQFTGTTSLQLILSGSEDTFLSSANLNKLLELEQKMSELENIGMIQSITLYLRMVNQALYGGDTDYFVIPEEDWEIDELFFFMELGGLTEEISRFITDDFSAVNLSFFLRTGSTGAISEHIEQVEAWASELFPAEIEYRISGPGHLYLSLNALLIESQALSLVFSLIMVFFIVALLYRSFIRSIFSLTALISAVILNFGLMGWLRIPLDVATVTISSIIVGIGIDYSIHFLSRLEAELKKYPLEDAIRSTISTSGKAIMFNAFALMGGFLVLLLSSFQTLGFIGLLVAITMISTSIGALTVLPLVLLYFKPPFTRAGG